MNVCLCRNSANIIFLTDIDSQKDHLYGTQYCINEFCLSIILKWIKVLMLELLCLGLEITTAGFRLCSWLLLMTNMGWSHCISYITSSRLAYPMINAHCHILRMLWWRSSNDLSVANLRGTWHLRPHPHFEVKRLKTHYSILSHTPENLWPMSWVSLQQKAHCKFANTTWQ